MTRSLRSSWRAAAPPHSRRSTARSVSGRRRRWRRASPRTARRRRSCGIRMMGGSVPTDKLVSALGLPFVIIPLVNSDNNQHSFDENIRLGHYLEGIRAFTGLLSAPF
jgi:hypothetical protein